MFFNTNTAGTLQTVKIIEKVTTTQFLVEDNRGRQFQVDSGVNYISGDYVVVKNKIIIGKSQKIHSIPNFIV